MRYTFELTFTCNSCFQIVLRISLNGLGCVVIGDLLKQVLKPFWVAVILVVIHAICGGVELPQVV